MLDKLEAINVRYLEVEKLISSANAMDDMKIYIQLSKEYKDLEPIIKTFKIYKNIMSNIFEAKEIISSSSDSEMKEMAKMELDELLPKVNPIEEEIKVLLIPKDPGLKGVLVDIQDTIKGFNMIMNGEVDKYPEAAFNLVGSIEEAIEKGEKMIAETK